ncbi:hypothetical protein BDB00DRAFT_872148 [Zychaea mexicana]|uniref:uncharacterized protein n=1 Tax=Zychaea mexicana TaxID=64656 RepID=UPI0022FEFF25|nr:uncharacterized protein BDB00DRAFT_872148 [Zychaea mexicana]KAI9493678.1 hypothetical protein BDB00DRAFT_872148 [Zychaea mexicana]
MQVQSTNNSNTTSIPLSFTITKAAELQLQDSTKGDTVTPQEWIARELARIRHDERPRHCPDYEGLIEVIDDMSKFLKQQAPLQQQCQQQQQRWHVNEPAVPATPEAAEHDRVVAKHLLIFQQQQQEQQTGDSMSHRSAAGNSDGGGAAALNFSDLVGALVLVVQYSKRHNNTTTTASDPHPVKLVRVLDDIQIVRDHDGGKIKDVASAQQRLFSILFGKVQLTSQLVHTWKIICEWAKQLLYARNWHEWMEFGLQAFVKAKQRCVTMETLIYSPNNSSTTSSSSSSSSSATAHHHGSQIMMEQLQALLQNTHLVEKTFRA